MAQNLVNEVKKLEQSIIPDDMVIGLFKQHLEDVGSDNFILDGFPRTIEQAKALDKVYELDYIFLLTLSDDIIIDRLSGRRVCPKCGYVYHVKYIIPKKEGICDHCGAELIHRDDDKPEAIKERLKTYHEKTAPLIGFYKLKGLLHKVDADKPIERVDEVIADFAKVLG